MDVVSITGLDIDKLNRDIQREYRLSGYEVDLTRESLELLINTAIELDTEEITEINTYDRSVRLYHDGKGKYISIRNLLLNPVSLLSVAESLLGENKLVLAMTFFLLLNALKYEMSEEEVYVFLAIAHGEKSFGQIDDGNIVERINHEIREDQYEELPVSEIYQIIRKLLKRGIIKVDKGIYSTQEKWKLIV